MNYIELNIYDEQKYVSIWLAKAECGDAELRENLKPLYEKYKKRKYRVVVFESGRGDLGMLTKDLLKHTLEVNARNEAE